MNSFLTRRFAVRALLLCAALLAIAPAQAQNTMVRLHTTMGPIDLTLLNTEAPVTVNNFLAYVRGGDYTDVFFHRNAWITQTIPFVVQGGGYKWNAANQIVRVTSRGQIVNEFSATRSNVRGTVAMAKVANQPNSATSEWFINMGNNAANLDTQNGGFAVFARVTPPGMVIADRISQLLTLNVQDSVYSFPELPVMNYTSGPVQRSNVVRFTEVQELPPSPSTSDRIFNYLEAAYPQFLVPTKGVDGVAFGYTFRYYGTSNAYLGTKDDHLWCMSPAINDGNITDLGTVANWLANAQANGY